MISVKTIGLIVISVAIIFIILGLPICKIWKRFNENWRYLLMMGLLIGLLGLEIILLFPKDKVKLTEFWLVYGFGLVGIAVLSFMMAFGDRIDGIPVSAGRPGNGTILVALITLETAALGGYSIIKAFGF